MCPDSVNYTRYVLVVYIVLCMYWLYPNTAPILLYVNPNPMI